MRSPHRAGMLRRLTGLAAAGVMVAAGSTAGAGAAPHGGHRGFKPGHAHPDLWLPDTEGKVRKLSDFGGTKLLVFHFASW